MPEEKYPLDVESVGSDTYIVMSKGHHDFTKFMTETVTQYHGWFLGGPQHVWIKTTPTKTTRAYALEKLNEHGEADATRQRHALFALGYLRKPGSLSPKTWVGPYGPEINTVRAAPEWAFSPSGHLPTGIELTLVSGCRTWAEKGLASAAASPLPLRQRILLQTALASVLMLTYGTGGPLREACRHVREDARDQGDAEHKLRALWGLWGDRCGCSQYAEAFELASATSP